MSSTLHGGCGFQPSAGLTGAGAVRRRWLVAGWLLALGLLALLVDQTRRPSPVTAADAQLFHLAEQGLSSSLLAWSAHTLALAGQRGILLFLVGVAALTFRRQITARHVASSLIALLGCATAVHLTKQLFPRPAPRAHLGLLLAHPGSSFPSGHVAGAAAAGWVLGLLAARRSHLGVRVGMSLLLAAAAAGGVTLLGYHWASDCASGLLLAVSVLAPLEFLGLPRFVCSPRVPTGRGHPVSRAWRQRRRLCRRRRGCDGSPVPGRPAVGPLTAG